MPHAVECICCCELLEVVERLDGNDGCVTCLETFKTVCLDANVLYTAQVTMHTVIGGKVEHR